MELNRYSTCIDTHDICRSPFSAGSVKLYDRYIEIYYADFSSIVIPFDTIGCVWRKLSQKPIKALMSRIPGSERIMTLIVPVHAVNENSEL